MAIRDKSRELHKLFKIVLDSEMEGTFTSCIFRTRRNPLAVVNIEITLTNDFRKRRGRKNMLYFGVYIVEEFRIVGKIRRLDRT